MPSDEARTLPAGVVRLGFDDDNTRFNDLWVPGGTLIPRGQLVTFDTLGVAQIPAFTPAQTGIRSLTADPTFVLNFGHLVTRSNARVETFPLSLAAGITRRLTIRVSVPIVHSRHTVYVNMNPTRFEGNVALNPAFASAQARATNTGVTMQFLNAASTLEQVLAACQANPAGSNCGTINSERSALQTLIAQGTSFANGVTQVYDALVVPVTGSTAQNKINSRDSSLTAQFNAAFQLAGLPGLTFAAPVAAPARAGLAELDSVLTDTTFGIAADSLKDADTYGIGDAEVSATFLLFDTFHGNDTLRIHPHGFQMRTAITGLVRLGTGTPPAENVLLDPGTGTGENAVEAHASADLLFGSHLWTTITARGTYQLSDNVVTRIPGVAGEVLDPLYSRATVRRQLGNAFEVEVDPRYTVNDYFAIYGLYVLRHKNDDSYSGTLSLDSAQTGVGPVRLDAGILGLNTAYTAQRIGFGLTFSTLAAAALRKHINLPVEVSYLHYETITGTGGYVPKTIVDRVSARVYLRLFGRRAFAF